MTVHRSKTTMSVASAPAALNHRRQEINSLQLQLPTNFTT